MSRLNFRKYLSIFLIVLMILLSGCVPKNYKTHPQYDISCKSINKYCLIKPEVKIVSLSAGGVTEVRDDWCAQGLENVLSALQKNLDRENVNYKLINIDENINKDIEDIQALYRAVSQSIRIHAMGPGPHMFPDKAALFEYSIGPIDSVLDYYDCDGLIIVYGTDAISTGGRKALMALGAVAGVFTGVVVMPGGGATTVNFALIDKNGDILYYTSKEGGGFDLRQPGSALSFVDQVLAEYPECIR